MNKLLEEILFELDRLEDRNVCFHEGREINGKWKDSDKILPTSVWNARLEEQRKDIIEIMNLIRTKGDLQ